MAYWIDDKGTRKEVLTAVNLEQKIKPTKHDDETLWFSDGSFISVDHTQNCCEYNYADFTSLMDTGFFESEFAFINLETFDGGFCINGFAVNCYSEQNGYYSNEVDIYYYSKSGQLLCYLEAYGEVKC